MRVLPQRLHEVAELHGSRLPGLPANGRASAVAALVIPCRSAPPSTLPAGLRRESGRAPGLGRHNGQRAPAGARDHIDGRGPLLGRLYRLRLTSRENPPLQSPSPARRQATAPLGDQLRVEEILLGGRGLGRVSAVMRPAREQLDAGHGDGVVAPPGGPCTGRAGSRSRGGPSASAGTPRCPSPARGSSRGTSRSRPPAADSWTAPAIAFDRDGRTISPSYARQW